MAFPFLAIPGIIGALGSLFGGKGKPTQYANMQSPADAKMRASLMAMIQGMMNKNRGVSAGVQPTTDALNLLYSKFFNRPYTPNVSMGTTPSSSGGGGGIIPKFPWPRSYATGGIANKPQMAMLAENGPEAIIPLGQYGQPEMMGMIDKYSPPESRNVAGWPGDSSLNHPWIHPVPEDYPDAASYGKALEIYAKEMLPIWKKDSPKITLSEALSILISESPWGSPKAKR